MSVLTKDNYAAKESALQSLALRATQRAAALPSSSDLSFHRSLDRSLAAQLDAASSRALSLTNSLLKLAATVSSTDGKGKGKMVELEDAEDFDDRFAGAVVERMDRLLERADAALDIAAGRTRAPAIAVNAPAQPKAKKAEKAEGGQTLPVVVQHAAHLAKPQLKWAGATVPKTHKWHARVPEGYVLTDTDLPEGAATDDTQIVVQHPYAYEITHIVHPRRMFISSPPIPFAPLDETSYTLVDTPELLREMAALLKQAKEVAVDLEHHSYRSYDGFVCLMQVSTRERDWIVDCLVPEVRRDMGCLGEVFADPNIIKVLHGAESDVVWLQQNFNLHLVNLFDTYHATHLLNFPRHGLATLLELYADFSPDKRYQLADWRIRPLPADMIRYARADTHFLLFVYDCVRNALLDRALSRSASPANEGDGVEGELDKERLVKEVLRRSAQTSLRVYVPETYDPSGAGPGGWDTLARKWNKANLMADARPSVQRAVYVAVHGWREKVAKEEDESVRYVLPNTPLLTLADRTPADMPALLACFGRSPPPVVRRRAGELLEVVRKAVRQALVETGAAGKSAAEAKAEDKMEVDAPVPTSASPVAPALVPAAVTATSLWSTPTSTSNAAASSSSLFPSIPTTSPIPSLSTPSPFSAPTSTLFSSAASSALFIASSLSTPVASTSKAAERLARLEAARAKLGGGMRVGPAPTAAVVPAISTPSEEVNTTAVAEPELVGATAAHAYIPASQRNTEFVPLQDTLVQVGMAGAGAGKRKRKRPAQSAGKKRGSSDLEEVEAGDKEEFDYASAPNLLDGYDVGGEKVGERERKKRRAKDAKGTQAPVASAFGRAPRDRTQVRGGNVSHTFRG